MKQSLLAVLLLVPLALNPLTLPAESVARQWNELLLESIRNDFARPPVHSRNLFHFSIAAWDAWAIYDDTAVPYFFEERPNLLVIENIQEAREETISYACYRLLRSRFSDSPGASKMLPRYRQKMIDLGYNPDFDATQGSVPSATGNRLAIRLLNYGLDDRSNEQNFYFPNNGYAPSNPNMIVFETFNPIGVNPNRWQPLALGQIIDQSGNLLPSNIQRHLGPHWGQLPPFGLTVFDEGPANVFLDPGRPPRLNTTETPVSPEEDFEYRRTFTDVVIKQSKMSPDLPELIDISPASRGNNTLGTNDGQGRELNPFTGQPYTPQFVKLGDYARCIAEYWADGPDSETPPGHWNSIANDVTDELKPNLRIGGVGSVVNELEWDVKLYLAINGATYDAAIAAWGIKGYYDGVRPITAIRYMSTKGQSSDPEGPSYHPQGILLEPGAIEVITAESSAPGERHEHLSGNLGEVAVLGWPGEPFDKENEYSGVRWILGREWLPYQRETFVTPPFAGYVSGHSTFSRAGAEVMAAFTGSPYFPGGMGTRDCPAGDYLVFEDGPSQTLQLQWATYFDAADESGISRIWGGIHPDVDDFPGRRIGSQVGQKAWARAQTYYNGTAGEVNSSTLMVY